MLSLDVADMMEAFPVLARGFPLFRGIGVAIAVILAVYTIMRSFFGELSEVRDTPLQVLFRLAISVFLIYYGPYFLQWVVNVTKVPYDEILSWQGASAPAPGEVAKDFFAPTLDNFVQTMVEVLGTVLSSGANLFLYLILMLCMGWELLKFLVEVFQRFIWLVVILFTAPLAFSLYTSRATSQSFGAWLKMFFSQCLLMVFSVWLLKAAVNGFSYQPGSAGERSYLLQVLATLALCRVGAGIDHEMQKISLNPTTAGGALLQTLTYDLKALTGQVRGLFRGFGGGRSGSSSGVLGAVGQAGAGGFGHTVSGVGEKTAGSSRESPLGSAGDGESPGAGAPKAADSAGERAAEPAASSSGYAGHAPGGTAFSAGGDTETGPAGKDARQRAAFRGTVSPGPEAGSAPGQASLESAGQLGAPLFRTASAGAAPRPVRSWQSVGSDESLSLEERQAYAGELSLSRDAKGQAALSEASAGSGVTLSRLSGQNGEEILRGSADAVALTALNSLGRNPEGSQAARIVQNTIRRMSQNTALRALTSPFGGNYPSSGAGPSAGTDAASDLLARALGDGQGSGGQALALGGQPSFSQVQIRKDGDRAVTSFSYHSQKPEENGLLMRGTLLNGAAYEALPWARQRRYKAFASPDGTAAYVTSSPDFSEKAAAQASLARGETLSGRSPEETFYTAYGSVLPAGTRREDVRSVSAGPADEAGNRTISAQVSSGGSQQTAAYRVTSNSLDAEQMTIRNARGALAGGRTLPGQSMEQTFFSAFRDQLPPGTEPEDIREVTVTPESPGQALPRENSSFVAYGKGGTASSAGRAGEADMREERAFPVYGAGEGSTVSATVYSRETGQKSRFTFAARPWEAGREETARQGNTLASSAGPSMRPAVSPAGSVPGGGSYDGKRHRDREQSRPGESDLFGTATLPFTYSVSPLRPPASSGSSYGNTKRTPPPKKARGEEAAPRWPDGKGE